jgi:lipid-binding SYLF domain-containing protein
VKKGAFIVGGEYGQGVVTCRTGHGWSGPVFIRLEGGSVGFQLGGQATDVVLVAVNDKGFQALLHDKFKIGGDASAAAGPVGRDAEASTDITLKAELLTWSRAKGLFAGIDLNGASISENQGRYYETLRRRARLRSDLAWKRTSGPRFKAVPSDYVEIFPERPERPLRDPVEHAISTGRGGCVAEPD